MSSKLYRKYTGHAERRRPQKKVLIIDEAGFSRICSAILETEGYRADIVTDISAFSALLGGNRFGLVITSYPYGIQVFEQIKKLGITTIILSDHINRDLIDILERFGNSYCMIKPLDYAKFKYLVNEVFENCKFAENGFNIL